MRLLSIVTLTAALASNAQAQDSFESRTECLQVLQRALQFSQHAEARSKWIAEALSNAPISDKEHLEAAIDATQRRAQADIDYADAVMMICQSYD